MEDEKKIHMILSLPLASDVTSKELVSRLQAGILMGYTSGFIWTSAVIPIKIAMTSNQTFRKAWTSTLPRRANGIFRWTAMTTLVQLCLMAFTPPNRHEDHRSLQAAERRGEIEDLREAFGERNFKKFQVAPSIETFFVNSAALGCLSMIVASRNPTSVVSLWLRRRSISRIKGVISATGICGVMAMFGPWEVLSGGIDSRVKLREMRRQKWKDLNDASIPEYTIGDNCLWLMRYRAARDGKVGDDISNDDTFESMKPDAFDMDASSWVGNSKMGDGNIVDHEGNVTSYGNAPDTVKPDASNTGGWSWDGSSKDGNENWNSGEKDK
ncbi:hypothetical protein EAF04_009541 [Stromatinia cepivora]|nr:hypothetical protein EAF04_009541 [Stromatinia cepivora]